MKCCRCESNISTWARVCHVCGACVRCGAATGVASTCRKCSGFSFPIEDRLMDSASGKRDAHNTCLDAEEGRAKKAVEHTEVVS